MLNEHDGDVARFQVDNVMLEFFCFAVIKSCGRFIQEDGMRVIDHRTGKFDKLLLPIGERSGKPLRMMRNAKFLEGRVGLFSSMFFGTPSRKSVRDQRRNCRRNEGDLQVLHDGHSIEKTDILVSASQSCIRNGDDPKNSVVDRDCRTHDHRNMFIAGTSVMPSSFCVNPTLTGAALSVRIADTLIKEI